MIIQQYYRWGAKISLGFSSGFVRDSWSHMDVKHSQFNTTEIMVSNWIPQIWGQIEKFPVSLNMVSYQHDFDLHGVFPPYFSRLRSL